MTAQQPTVDEIRIIHTANGFSAKSIFPHGEAYVAEVYYGATMRPTLADIVAAFDATKRGNYPGATGE